MLRKLILGIFLVLVVLSFTSASDFGYNNPTLPNVERFVEYLDKTGDSATGTFDFDGGWMNNGLTISGGNIYAQTGYFYNITSLNITRQNLTVLGDLIVNGNISLKFGDLVSEKNPDGADAIRIKSTADSVDVVIGGMTGLFSIWNVADNTPVFYVTERGATDITGILDMNTNKIVGVVDPTANQEVATKKYVDDNVGGGIWQNVSGVATYNGNVNITGNLNVTGNITASYFKGDGSLLTGVSGGGIWQNISGVATYNNRVHIGETDYFPSGINPLVQIYDNDTSTYPQLSITQQGTGDSAIVFDISGSPWMMGVDNTDNNFKISGSITNLATLIYLIIDRFGNVNVTGNITSENVFLPAYISSHTNDTIPVVSAGVWYNITFDQEADEFKRRITHTTTDATNTTFTIQDTGTYEITYSLTVEDSQATPLNHVVARVIKNNVELNGFTIESDTTKQNADLLIHNSDLVELVVGDKLNLQFTSDATTVSLITHLTYGVHQNTGHITITRIA